MIYDGTKQKDHLKTNPNQRHLFSCEIWDPFFEVCFDVISNWIKLGLLKKNQLG